MADHSIRIGIDSSEAERGAARVSRSLRDIVAQAARVSDVRISLDGSRAGAEAARVSRSLRDIQEQASRLSARPLAVRLDAAGMREGVQAVSRTLREIAGRGGGTLPVRLDTSEAEAGAARVSRSLRDIVAQAARVSSQPAAVRFDTAGVDAAVAKVSRSLREIAGQGVGKSLSVDLDPAPAEAGARRISAALRDVREQASRSSSQPVAVKFDTAGMDAAAAKLSRSLREVAGQGAGRSFSVRLDSSAAEDGAKRISAALRDVREQASRFSSQTVSVRFDTAGMDEAVARVSRTLRRIAGQEADKKLSVGLDTSAAEDGARRISAALVNVREQASRFSRQTVAVRFDTAGMDAAVSKVSRTLRQIAGQGGGNLSVGLDTSAVQDGARRISAALADVRDQASRFSRQTVSVRFDTAGMDAAVAKVSRTLREISGQGSDKKLSVDLDPTSAEAGARRISAALSAVREQASRFSSQTVAVKFDTAGMDEAVAKISRTLREIGQRTGAAGTSFSVGVNVDASGAEAGVARARRSLRDLQVDAARATGSGKGIPVTVDAGGAEAGAARVSRSLRDIVAQASKVGSIRVGLDTGAAQSSAATLSRSLKDIRKDAEGSGDGLGVLSAAAAGTRTALGGVAAAFSAIKVSKDIVEATAKFQDLETRLTTLTGSASAAAEAQAYLAATAQRMSIDVFALSDSYVKFLPLIKAGVISTEEARTTLEGLGNIAAATGAKSEQLGNVMYGLGQALSAPKTNAEDLNQVVEPLPGLLQELDKAAGLPAGGFKQMVKEGRVTAEFFKQTLIKALAEYDGAAEKTAGNINATTTRMKNAWNDLLNTIGQNVASPVSAVMEGMIRLMESVENGIKRLAAIGASLKESFDWTAPLASIGSAWDKATAANPTPASVGGPPVQGPPAPPRPPPTITAKLEPKKASATRTTGDRFAEQKRELEEQVAAQKDLAAAYDYGRPAVERYQAALDDLSDRQRLNAGYSKTQADSLHGLMAELREVQKAAAVREAVGAMEESIQKAKGLAEAHREGATAVQHVEAANAAYDKALRLGVVGNKEMVDQLLAVEKAAQKADAALRLAESLSSMDIDISSLEMMGDAYREGGGAAREAAVSNEVYAQSIRLGISGDAEQIAVLREKVQALHDANDATEEAKRSMDRGFDIEQAQAELDMVNMTGEARLTEAARLDMLMEKKRRLSDDTATLTAAEEAQAAAMGHVQYQAQLANGQLGQLSRSIPDMATAWDMAAAGGLMHFEDALVDIVTGAKSAREAFADMAKSIAADLARMAIRMAIIQPLAMMFGGAGMVGANVGIMGASMARVAHTGGVIGMDPLPQRRLPAFHTGGLAGFEVPSVRSLPPVASWTRYHAGGLAGGEVPAVLKRGEGVFTPGQMANLAPVGDGGGATNNITVNVTAQQGMDQGAAERQGRAIARQIEQAMNDKLMKERRNGGLLSNS